MDFITERTIGGKTVVLVKEIVNLVDKDRFDLALESGVIQAFVILPETKMPEGRARLYQSLNSYVGDSALPTGGLPERLHPIRWCAGMNYNGLFVEVERIKHLLQDGTSHLNKEDFLLSIRDTLNGILAATRDVSGIEALKRATKYLGYNPCEKINVNWLSKEDFPECSDPLVTHRGRIANTILSNNGFSQLPQQEIKKILAAKK